MEEIWKEIEFGYEVSNLGNVRNKEHIKQLCNVNGYMYVHLWLKGKMYNRSVHRLVATAFIENPNNYPQVDHIDGNRSNNNVENLRWITCSLNNLCRGKKSTAMAKGVYFYHNKYVARIYYDKSYHYLGRFETIEEASKVYEEKRKEIINQTYACKTQSLPLQ